MSESEVPTEFVRALNELGLSNASSLWGAPLTGGVSSDIWRIDTEKGAVCAKRALSKLRVKADWYAPVERNLYEARWLQVAHQAAAACAPKLLGQHPELGVLVMQFLDPDLYRVWKQELRAGHADSQTAHAMGEILSKIHSHAAKNSHLASEFPTDKIFLKSDWHLTCSPQPSATPNLRTRCKRWCCKPKTMPKHWCMVMSAPKTSC